MAKLEPSEASCDQVGISECISVKQSTSVRLLRLSAVTVQEFLHLVPFRTANNQRSLVLNTWLHRRCFVTTTLHQQYPRRILAKRSSIESAACLPLGSSSDEFVDTSAEEAEVIQQPNWPDNEQEEEEFGDMVDTN